MVRVEMRQFNVSVHLIEPGAFATAVGSPQNLGGRMDQIWKALPDDVKQDYGEDHRAECNYISLNSRDPAHTKHLYNMCTMLDQRRRRWADVVQML